MGTLIFVIIFVSCCVSSITNLLVSSFFCSIGANSIYAYNVERVISVEVIDKNTIKINLSEEVPFFEYNLTFPIMSHYYYENEDFVNTEKISIMPFYIFF